MSLGRHWIILLVGLSIAMTSTMMKNALISLLGFAAITGAKQAANFDISLSEAQAHHCGFKCQSNYNQTQAADISEFRKVFDFDFYATAANFTGSKAGDLLKLEPLDPDSLNVKTGQTVYRFQYTSVDLDGSLAPATGFIAFPYTSLLDDGRFRLAAFAHGTSGVYRGCAPSNSPTLYEDNAWSAIVQNGYAVVGTDYIGIGNNYTTHKFLSFPAQATDVYYSTIAARQAFGRMFTDEWFSFGHSQGGGTVWKLAESDFVQKDKNYLGTVALAPATYVVDMFLSDFETYPYPGLGAILPTCLRRAQPSYNYSIVTDVMQGRMQLEEQAQVCFTTVIGMGLDLRPDQVIDKSKLSKQLPQYQAWQKQMAPALGAQSAAPVLVVQGGADSFILPSFTEEAVKTSCRAGNEIHFRLYPGLDHTAIEAASQAEWTRWVDGLFNKGPEAPKKACSNITRQPVDAKHMKAPLDIDPKDFET